MQHEIAQESGNGGISMPLSLKLWLPIFLSLLCLAGMAIHDAYRTKALRLEERKADLVHASEIALTVIKTFGDQVASGAMSEADAKKRAKESIRNMRYGESGYFTILNSQPTIVMHPTKPELDGKDVSGFKDPNGVYLYKDAVAVIKRDGKGFNEYAFPKP